MDQWTLTMSLGSKHMARPGFSYLSMMNAILSWKFAWLLTQKPVI